MDYSLHARIRAGDPEAFRELFRAHAQLVFRHAVRVSGDRSTAEDVVSLTFLEAWRLRAKLRDEGETPRPWVMGIAVNVLRNTARAARRHAVALTRLPAKDTVPDFVDELVGRMADAEELAAAGRALRRLRRGERDVFTLCVWSGLSYTEAAQALGVPVGTVRSRLSRTRTRLRALAAEELAAGRRGSYDRRGPHEKGPHARMEPVGGSGQEQGGRTRAARSGEETDR
ncbi:RNA polymerase sigma factor [Streptomyces griseofuscus]|uniref:RNA polymerase sigma factor n=1 Tax=Streptomyces griseofuscus TaxID=146922 RepID=UPI0034115DEB